MLTLPIRVSVNIQTLSHKKKEKKTICCLHIVYMRYI